MYDILMAASKVRPTREATELSPRFDTTDAFVMVNCIAGASGRDLIGDGLDMITEKVNKADFNSRRADARTAPTGYGLLPADPLPATALDNEFNLGAYIKRARQARNMRLRDLADQAGCSESLISKLENNKASASVRLLTRVCSALNITVGDLFTWAQHGDEVVNRAADRVEKRFAEDHGPAIFMQYLGPPRLSLEAFLHVIEPGWSSETMQHEGEEIGYVIEGSIELRLNDAEYSMSAGDSFSFQSDTPHVYRNTSSANARVIIVNSPPSL
ncbi:cupin domain-containing protein [Sphingobium sp. HWE2-09]|uniref:cupin domain-containing protein n=1 Tax=Sphingobium sp. HWE2-09 TaxID=3108390 RepID=UPI002DD368FC|nr:cupin domain-containing protein [Sphingobium sp. HWE2-09]